MARYQRKDDPTSLGEAIKAYIRVHNMQGKLDAVDVTKAWEETGGPAVVKITRSMHLASAAEDGNRNGTQRLRRPARGPRAHHSLRPILS